MSGHFDGKVALVTGSASGIGRASAYAFARERAKVIVADVDVKGGEETVRMIKNSGGDSIFLQADVSEAVEVEALINEIVAYYGFLDCALNNAGIVEERALTADCTEEMWDQVIKINLKGVWLCMKYEIRQMLIQNRGAIVNTSSVLGLVGGAMGSSAYVASKHGVVGLTKAAALEYAKTGIRINAICPGATITPLVKRRWDSDPKLKDTMQESIPFGRLADPEEIAETVIWLCSDAASYITGQSIAIDGGRVAA
ncbi:SDR family oxidoreductase [Chloroflexota bacterium]